jgi:predicted amino acid racemase
MGDWMFPRIIISEKKLKSNIDLLISKCKGHGISIMGISKVFAGNLPLLEILKKSGVSYIGDSRIKNLKKITDCDIPKVLIRLPMISEIEDVIDYVDISFNSEISTISQLNDLAASKNTRHKIVLMVDLGDLREGVLAKDVDEIVNIINDMKNIDLVGIAVNLTCYGGVIPSSKNLGELVEIKNKIEKIISRKLEIVSGGNSSSLFLLEKDNIPNGVNNLRLGESIAIGRETAYGKKIEESHDDVFILQAEIIEIRNKPSVPRGEIGMDAFGNTPVFEDRGIRRRAILAIGKQDVSHEEIIPLDKEIIILGSSSDHLIIDITDSNEEYRVGSIIDFKLTYSSLLSVMTSEYVEKKIL